MKNLMKKQIKVPGYLGAIFWVTMISLSFAGCENKSPKNEHISWHLMMLESEMHRNPQAWMLDFESRPKWNYTHGLVLMATEKIWRETGDQRYFDYILEYYEDMIDDQGNINYNYKLENFNIDHIKPGINLFTLYEQTGDERYHKAMLALRNQLKIHPRTHNGAFWHKQIYPHQLWLDGVYMNTPFYARYGKEFNEPQNFEDVTLQILVVEEKTRDADTGLLYHAYDESREQAWADSVTGKSPNFWGRAMGWYMMALVDAAEYFPQDHHGIEEIRGVLIRLTDALIQFQDSETGLWYQVVDKPGKEGNYQEGSVSSMVAYSIIKAVNKNLLDPSYLPVAQKTYQGLLDHLISFDDEGFIHLNNICGVAGLGGNPYRDGSYDYYINEIIRANDPKGVGPFMLLSIEMEKAGIYLEKTPDSQLGKRVAILNQ